MLRALCIGAVVIGGLFAQGLARAALADGAQPLVVHAGASPMAALPGDQVQLTADGTAGDPAGALTYTWTADDPALFFDDPSQASTYFIAPATSVPVDLVLTLTVTETFTTGAAARTERATVTVTVAPNRPPVVTASGPASATEGTSVTLDASASSDPDGGTVSLSWTQTGGPSVMAGGVTGATVSFTAPAVPEGETGVALTFEVTASDGSLSASKAVTVMITRATPAGQGSGGPGTGVAGGDEAGGGQVGGIADTQGPDAAAVIAQTEAQLGQFAESRMNGLIGTQPDLGAIVSGGEGSADVTVSSMGGQVDLSTAPDQPFWLHLRGNWSTVDAAEGDYILGAAGAHVLLGEGLALGLMAQVDHLQTRDGLEETEGTGYLVGPYVVARLPDQPVVVQGRLLYGASDNSLSPFGTYVDSFDGTRLLAQLGVSGQIAKGSVVWRPSLQAAYARERTDAYTDGAGNPIGAGQRAMTQVSAGIDVRFPLPVPSGSMTATFGLSDIWAGGLDGGTAAYAGHRGKLSFGLDRTFGSGAALSLTGSYDGLGATDYESLSLDLMFRHRF